MEPLLLLQAVREVSHLADPEHPLEVSQRAFDAACAQDSRSLPHAKHIAAKLKVSWRELVAIAHQPASTHAHRLGTKGRDVVYDWLTPDHVAFALKLVAQRLGTETLTPGQYRVEQKRLLEIDRKHWLHGKQLLLPNDDQICAAAGDWDTALAWADLATRPGLGGYAAVKYAASPIEILERCYQVLGTEPTGPEAQVFAKANGIPYNYKGELSWLQSVAHWKAERRANTLPVPDGPPPFGERPDYAKDVGAARPGEKRLRNWMNIDDCVACVVRYLAQLSPGERSTKRRYGDWARGRADAPSASAFDQHGGWEAVRSIAVKQLPSSQS